MFVDLSHSGSQMPSESQQGIGHQLVPQGGQVLIERPGDHDKVPSTLHSCENLRKRPPDWQSFGPCNQVGITQIHICVAIRSFSSPMFNSGRSGRKPSCQYIAGVDILTHVWGLQVLCSVISEMVSEIRVGFLGPSSTSWRSLLRGGKGGKREG